MNNLIGQTFGRLTVLDFAFSSNKTYWLCKCNCGAEKIVRSDKLTSGHIKSCGCLKKEQDKLNLGKIKHGLARRGKIVPEHNIWCKMKKRCEDSTNLDYGARGIKVCERWHKFENFIADMGLRPSKNHTIERKDNNGNYCPENCTWATRQEQSLNKRNNINITIDGNTKNLSEWAKKCGISYKALNHYYHRKDLDVVIEIIRRKLNEKGRP